ncbi:hypothetical protein HmCmsJML131_02713 [Escherichia coli]|uniref:Uncharacterized protein n=1 Tax=Escherichia coli TaxID=562 RepID=A0A4C7APZ0_ECOLX|nr:hypothetical protein HmCmsJML131_02713 [Escherichia coli]
MKSLRIGGGRIMSLDIVSTEKDVTFGLLKEQWHIIKNHPGKKTRRIVRQGKILLFNCYSKKFLISIEKKKK